jgi:HPt (histidine-containing phosphotransfer) domain-containing protein
MMRENSDAKPIAIDANTEVFDRAKLLYATDGDEELANVLIDVFLETAPATLTSVREAIVAGSARELRLAAHSLKGAAATVTAGRVAAAAHALETCGADGRLDEAPALLERLATALAEFSDIPR